jgi:diguanylate cyclase (GGDEF)-like protein/PAS domain S-box-containing protein
VNFLKRVTKILLIEASGFNFNLLNQIFTELTFKKIELVQSKLWQDGINYLEQNQVDLVLLDFALPDLCLSDCFQKIRQITQKLPLIILIEQATQKQPLSALQLGVQDYLLKTDLSNETLLIKTICYAIERKQLIQKIHQNEIRYLALAERMSENSKSLPYEHLSSTKESGLQSLDRGIIDHLDAFKDTSQTSSKKLAETIVEIEEANLINSLPNSQELVQILTHTAPVLIWITNIKGELIFCNQFCLDFLGASVPEKLIHDWFFYVAPEDRVICRQAYQAARYNHQSFQIECRILRFDGEYRWIINHTVPRFNQNGKFSGFICSGIDITQRKLEEKLLIEEAQRDRALTKITQQIHASLNLETILQTAIQVINQLFPAKKILIAKVISPTQVKILFEAVNLEKGSNCDLLTSKKESIIDLEINWQKLQRGEIVILDNFSEENLNSELQLECQSCTLLNIPLITEKKLWGLLSIQKCLTVEQWQSSNIEILQQIALHLAIAIQQSELYQQLAQANRELEQLAVVDGLTGIANRRKFDEYFANEWLRLTREQSPLALILCDLDYFKLYNDTYGHQAGDRCLHQVAQAVSKTIKRPADLAARYGGEELAVILPHTTLEGAAIVANQICLQIKALAIPHINSPIDLYVTLSVGVAGCIPSQDSSPEFLIKTADQALYQAKQLGRNRIVRATTNVDI